MTKKYIHKTIQKRKHRDFQEFLLENLQDPQEAAAYLQATLNEEDERVLLIALHDVLQARGDTVKTKSFQAYLETRLNKDEIAEIEARAQQEIKKLQSMQKPMRAFKTVKVKTGGFKFNRDDIYR